MSESRIIPNSFQTPNILTDTFMRYLTGDELKVYVFVVRKTFGWQKLRDRIAKTQVMRAGGLSEPRAQLCLSNLVRYRLIKITAENDPTKNQGKEYEIELDDRKIDIEGLERRQQERRGLGRSRISKARSLRGVGLSDRAGSVPQGEGGVVAQGTQKPLRTKTTLSEKQKKEIIDEANKAVDTALAFADGAEVAARAGKAWKQRDIFIKISEPYALLADQLVLIFGAPGKSEAYAMLQVVTNFVENGVEPLDIANAGIEVGGWSFKPTTCSSESFIGAVRRRALERQRTGSMPAAVVPVPGASPLAARMKDFRPRRSVTK